MAIKEDLNAVKNELSTEEQFLENMIKSERFVKRYKRVFIGVLAVGVVGLAAYYISGMMERNRIANSSAAYTQLLANPNDASALEKLKAESPSLYALVKFKSMQDSNDTAGVKTLLAEPIDPVLKQIFSAYIGEGNGAIMAGYDALVRGYELLKQDKVAEAKVEFAKVPADSPLFGLVKNLQHYQGNKK